MSEIGIVERLRFDATRCEIQFSKGVASNISEAADEIERLHAFANSFGICACDEGGCDPTYDFQCRAREALTGKSNVRR